MIKNILLSAISALFGLALVEAFLHIDDRLISDGLIYDFPKSELRSSLLAERGLIPERSDVEFLESSVGGQSIPIVMKPTYKRADPEDVDYGAIDVFNYHNGYCNVAETLTTPRLIALGDSFTFCTAVPIQDAWPKKIAFGGATEDQKYNLGVPGMGPYEYLEILKSKIVDQTEVVIVGLYEGNDLRDSLDHDQYIRKAKPSQQNDAEPEVQDAAEERQGIVEVGRWVATSLYTPNLAWATTKQFFLTDRRTAEASANFRYQLRQANGVIPFNVNNVDLDEVKHAVRVAKGELDFEEIYRLWLPPLKDIQAISNEHAAKLILVYIPSAYTAFGDLSEFQDPEVADAVHAFSKTQQNVFARICRDLAATCVDVIDTFRNHNKDAAVPTHFPSNVHLTPAGHALLAAQISKALLD